MTPEGLGRQVGGLLTRRGWALLTVSLLCAPVGRLFGVEECYGLAAAGLTAVAVAVGWARSSRWAVEVERHVHPLRLGAGERATVELSIHNRALRPSPVLALRDPFGDGRPSPELLVAPIAPRRTRVHNYRLPAVGRGLVSLGPLTAAVSDPFGLATRTRQLAPAERVIVHPSVGTLRTPVLADTASRQGVGRLARAGSDNDEFATLREYRPGDDPRKVHWASSARRDTLLVREDEQTRHSRTVVVVDQRASMWTPAGFETALGAAASVVDEAIRSRLRVRLLATDGTDSGLGEGLRHRAKVLDEITVAAMHGAGSFTLGRSRPGGRRLATGLTLDDATVVVTSDRLSTDDLRRMRELAQPAPVTLVIVEVGRAGGDSGRAGHSAPAPLGSDSAPRQHPPVGHAVAGRATHRVVRIPAGAAVGPPGDEVGR